MTLAEIAASLKLECLTPELPDAEATGGYTSDLLSDVLANAPGGGILMTVQAHMNVVAVAVHAGLAAVVFVHGRRPDENVRKKAVEEGVRLYVSPDSAFNLSGRLYELGLRGPGA